MGHELWKNLGPYCKRFSGDVGDRNSQLPCELGHWPAVQVVIGQLARLLNCARACSSSQLTGWRSSRACWDTFLSAKPTYATLRQHSLDYWPTALIHRLDIRARRPLGIYLVLPPGRSVYQCQFYTHVRLVRLINMYDVLSIMSHSTVCTPRMVSQSAALCYCQQRGSA